MRTLVGIGLLAVGLACGGTGGDVPVAVEHVLTMADGTHPTVAVDPRDGTTYVAWVHMAGEGDDQDVHLIRLPPGLPPAAAVRVNRTPGDATPHEQAPAQVSVGPGGEVYVMWQKRTAVEGRRFGASALRMARSLDGGRTFEAAIDVADFHGPVPASHTFHTLLVAPDGRIVASWLDGRAGLLMETGGMEGHDPGTEVRVAVSDDGGVSFGPSVVVASNVCPCCRTALARGPDGTIYVGWRHIWPEATGKEIRDLAVARSEDGGSTFAAPVRIHADGWVHDGCPHAGPALAVDGSGHLHALWYTGNPGAAGVFHARSEDGGRAFGPATPLLTGEWVPPSRVALTALGNGDLAAAWEDRRQEPPQLGRLIIPGGGSPDAGRGSTSGGTFPMLAAGPNHRALVWLEGEAVHVRIEEIP